MPDEVRVYVYRRDPASPATDHTRDVLARELGVPPSELVFRRTCALCGGPHGKPSLDVSAHGAGAPQFSVSRSGSLQVIAVSTSAVGIDVELVRPLDAAGIAANLFSPGEAALIGGLEPAIRLPAFLTLWTRKEALGKALALGLSDEVLATDVSGPAGLVELATLGSWMLFDVDVGTGAKAALATSPAVAAVRIFRD